MQNDEKVRHLGQFSFFLGIIFLLVDYGRELAVNSSTITNEQSFIFLNNFFMGYAAVILVPIFYFSLIVVGAILWFASRYFKEDQKPEREDGIQVNVSQSNVPTNV